MGMPSFARAIERVEDRVRARQRLDAGVLDRLRADPAVVMSAGGMEPDPWQAGVFRSQSERIMLLCSRQCFDAGTVVLDRTGRATRICHHPDAWATGVRPVRRYTVRGGASVTVTDNHPLWSEDGWVPAGTLKRGDRIAVLSEWGQWPAETDLRRDVQHGTWVRPRTTNVEFALTEDLGRLLGYLATDGSNRPGQSIKFTNNRPGYLAEVEGLARAVTGVEAKRYAKGAGFDLLFTTSKARHDNRLMDLMRSLRWDERFPTDVFAFPLPAVAAFVNRAWAGDGCVRQGKGGHPEVFLACKNEVYGRYFQLLLMKLGVHARLTTEWMKKCTRPFHRLVLGSGRHNLERFFAVVGPIFGKEERSRAVLDHFRRTTKAQDYRKVDHRGRTARCSTWRWS